LYIAFVRAYGGQSISLGREPATLNQQTPPTADPVTIQDGSPRLP
jgi:hypothetical protein